MNGGGGNSSTLIMVAGLGAVCLSCMALSAFVLFNEDANAKFKDLFGLGDNNSSGESEDPPSSNEGTAGYTDPVDPPADPGATTPDTPVVEVPTTSTAGCGPDKPTKCTSADGKHYVCKYPWDRPQIKFNSSGTGPRCCADINSKFDGSECKKNEQILVNHPRAFSPMYKWVNAQSNYIYKQQPVVVGKCYSTDSQNKLLVQTTQGFRACFDRFSESSPVFAHPLCVDGAGKPYDPKKAKVNAKYDKCVENKRTNPRAIAGKLVWTSRDDVVKRLERLKYSPANAYWRT